MTEIAIDIILSVVLIISSLAMAYNFTKVYFPNGRIVATYRGAVPKELNREDA